MINRSVNFVLLVIRARKRSLVMFLYLFAILLTGGRGGVCQGDPLPYGKERAVRILLGCILIYEKVDWVDWERFQ